MLCRRAVSLIKQVNSIDWSGRAATPVRQISHHIVRVASVMLIANPAESVRPVAENLDETY